ncbi:MAG: ribosome small subunit-dependent GTPase A [Cytophagales bacterium]|nr:ribosome small subunit-dependent GTPase A [Cytophagales bacterium]
MNSGLVVGSHGHHVVVETPAGERVICHARGKKNQCVVGDRVQWQASKDEGTIEKIESRRNLLYRQDDIRSKQFAANLDLVLFVLAAEPVFSESQLARALISCEAAKITPVIVLNKADLTVPFNDAMLRLAPYKRMGYDVLGLAIKPTRPVRTEPAEVPRPTNQGLRQAQSERIEVVEQLLQVLQGKTTFVMGASGVGKSSLINLLLPDAEIATREISTALNSGKHTTTTTSWFWLDESKKSAIIDSPGFQEFGLHHVDKMHLAKLMPDFAQYDGECRFYNCTHLHEPQCAVLANLSDEPMDTAIHPSRHAFYARVFEELSQSKF